jgi:Rieske Fe-S protein
MSEGDLSRRAALSTGAGVMALSSVALGAVACTTYSTSAPAPVPAQDAAGSVLAKAADIEVGGGKVFTAEQVVVTQPESGTFKAFSAVCTHQGCIVSEVAAGTINCPCHGSKFKAADGSVANGPATSPLAAKKVTVKDGSIVLA